MIDSGDLNCAEGCEQVWFCSSACQETIIADSSSSCERQQDSDPGTVIPEAQRSSGSPAFEAEKPEPASSQALKPDADSRAVDASMPHARDQLPFPTFLQVGLMASVKSDY